MSANRYRPHVFILPEDDANRQLALGFALEFDSRQVQVLNEAGGWLNVCERFQTDHAQAMRNCPERCMILLIDFDEDPNRLAYVSGKVPAELADRVFFIGTWSEPEALKRSLGRTYEAIGRSVARDCLARDRGILQSDLLNHNMDAIDRVCAAFDRIF